MTNAAFPRNVVRDPHDGRAVIAAIEAAIQNPRDGLTRGERALVGLAVSIAENVPRAIARNAQDAARLTRDPRVVALLVEEGFPSPLTGRNGALVAAASAVSRPGGGLRKSDVVRLEVERIDAVELVDIILSAALAGLRNRLPQPRNDGG